MSQQQNEHMFVKVHFTKSIDTDLQQSQQNQLYQNKSQKQQTKNEAQQVKDQIYEYNEQKIGRTLQKLVNFIKFHSVDSYDIWKHKKEIKISQFITFITSNYAYNFSQEELSALQNITTKKNYLKSRDFQSFDLWKQQPKSITRLLSSSNLKKAKHFVGQRSQSPKEAMNTWFNQESNMTSQQGQKSNFYNQRSNINFSTKFRRNFNQESFQEAKKYSEDKLKLKVQKLKKNIKQSVLQKKWDFIVMAGQMNLWIDQLKKKSQKQSSPDQVQPLISYRYKIVNKDPAQIIQQNTNLGTEEQIPQIVFVKKHQTLKKRMVKQQNQKNNLKGTVLMVLEDNDKLNKNNLNNRVNQRDQELNFVLLQIMRMKSIFQWQNNLLKEAKINS